MTDNKDQTPDIGQYDTMVEYLSVKDGHFDAIYGICGPDQTLHISHIEVELDEDTLLIEADGDEIQVRRTDN